MVRFAGCIILPTVLFLLAPIGVSAQHKFVFSGKISCPRIWFFYALAVYEDDPGADDDYGTIASDSFYPHYYHFEYTENNPGDGSPTYEHLLKFVHTCTDTGEAASGTFTPPDVAIGSKTHFEIKHDVDLYKP